LPNVTADYAFGSNPPYELCENSKVRSATRMIFLISISKLNALAMWAHEKALNEKLVLSRLIAFAFSHGLDPNRSWRDYRQNRLGGTAS
jgi:hypothetical protein